MARNQTDKKLVSFTNLNLLNRLIKDEAEKENRSESAIIENHLLDVYLPKNSQARFIVEEYLYSEISSVEKTLSVIFELNSAGINFGSQYDNLFPLVEYAYEQELSNTTFLTGEEKDIYYIYSQMTSVVLKLKNVLEKVDEYLEREYYLKEIEVAEYLLNQLKEEPDKCNLANVYRLLINNWEVLKSWSITYRLLAALVTVSKGWNNTPDARIKLLKIIKIVSEEWLEKDI